MFLPVPDQPCCPARALRGQDLTLQFPHSLSHLPDLFLNPPEVKEEREAEREGGKSSAVVT